MKIAILGAGHVGGALTRAARDAGHDVIVAAKHADKAEALAKEAGARAARTPREAVDAAEVVVLAIPYGAVRSAISELGPLDGRVLIDVTNPLTPSMDGLATERSAAEEIRDAAPEAKVVKAFNTLFASRMERPNEGGVPLDAFLAGDDADAKGRVGELARSLGFRPIDVGGLRMARALEGLALLNIRLNATNGWSWQSGWKLVGPTG
jgi:hypothetical protein